jgi:hypothetical protein
MYVLIAPYASTSAAVPVTGSAAVPMLVAIIAVSGTGDDAAPEPTTVTAVLR